jgi:hypothetical protein
MSKIDRDQLDEEFPANNKYAREHKEQTKAEKKIEKVVTGKVKTQKRSLGKKFMDTFIEDDSKNVGNYIFHDVLIPAAKSMVCDIVGWGGFAEMLLFANKRPPNRGNMRRDGGRTYVSYDRSSTSIRDNRDTRKKDISPTNRARHNFDEIILDSRGEAEEVLSQLVDLIEEYGIASVADLYELVGLKSEHTDQRYGWTNLSAAEVSRVRDGYLINLPRTKLID